ncbi:hypothetical protein FSARC_8541 [Fusarium sarcochroum]|uniref:Xylanolytic transcriptional activator regulatory domain-containing protein n=1 Tax=Fusarium sarcochroum TaxID=1208366 RepID=A0A8H4TT29_9HYPO|nr:hypothetical protein FSARC_8541 [Fusarium sarcochroum]
MRGHESGCARGRAAAPNVEGAKSDVYLSMVAPQDVGDASIFEESRPQGSDVSTLPQQIGRVQPRRAGSLRKGDRPDVDAQASESSPLDIEASLDRPPPLVSILDDTENSNTAPSHTSVTPRTQVITHAATICATLRSVLPSYDEITTVLTKNGAWWNSFPHKTRAISQAEPVEALLTFAAHAYTSTSPAELAMLAVAYGRSLGQNHDRFSLVDSLIISDFALISTLDGMECLILLAKTYTDMGQPRRAWFTWRKDIAIAQMMGLHLVSSDIPTIRPRIWWAIYHGDRYTSMLLGLPHGIDDATLGKPFSEGIDAGLSENWLSNFIHQCAAISGQIITHILCPVKPSFAKAMALDEQMDTIYVSAQPAWWNIRGRLPSSRVELDAVVERLLIHFFFFHTRMYIHLPFLKSSHSSVYQNVSRKACTDAARQMARRFLALHNEVDRGSLFECKTSDFVGFTGAVVLLIGNSHSECSELGDLQLVAKTEAVFEASERHSGCKIATRCRRALSLLCNPLQNAISQEIPIPYFGKVVRSKSQNPRNENQNLATDTNTQLTSSTPSTAPTSETPSTWMTTQGAEYVCYINDLTMDGIWGMGGSRDDTASLSSGLGMWTLMETGASLPMEDTNPTTTTTTTRVAYMRTILDKEREHEYIECDWLNVRTWLRFWVGQSVNQDSYGYERRYRSSPPPVLYHKYILGHSTAADSLVLDWLLDNSQPGSWRLSRADFEVYLSEAQVADPANEPLLQRLEKEGVGIKTVAPSTPTEFTTDDICDSAMLSSSDYVLESRLLRGSLCYTSLQTLHRDSLRHGHPQRYDTEERSREYYQNRLKIKMGHTRRCCSYPHGKSEAWKRQHEENWKAYKCPSCGKRCKRSKGCKTTGEWRAEDKSKTAWSEGVDTSAPRPPDFEKYWRGLSAEDVISYWGPDLMTYHIFRNCEWRSVDTFSDE